MDEHSLSLHEQAVKLVYSTGRWYRFFAVLSIIGIVLMALIALIFFFMGSAINRYMAEMAEMGGSVGISFPPFLMGVIYLLCAAVYVPIFIYLNRGARAARTAAETGSNEAAVAFLANTKSFWKFYGILSIVVLAVCILIFPAMFIVGLSAAL